MALALDGLSVIELGSNVAGPYAGWILGALGAEVIKIERPGSGDDARGWGPPFWHGASTLFQSINTNKRSLTVDYKDPDQVAKLKALILARGDVVVQNLRPRALLSTGLDGASLLAEKPSLIYCNLHAFGAHGPLSDRPGYDALMQAYGGLMSVTGEADGNPVRTGNSSIDMGTGMWCAIGILAALERRRREGRGGLVDASLLETTLAWMQFYTTDYQITGELPKRAGSGAKNITPYRAFTCSDGQLMVAAPNDRLFRNLATALGHGEWGEDERFTTSPARAEHRHLLNPMIDDAMAGESRAHWRAVLDKVGIPNAPIHTVSEAMADPQTEALGIFQATDDPAMKLGGLPLSFDGGVVLFPGPDWKRQIVVHEFKPSRAGAPPRGGCIHSTLLDVDGDGDADFCGSNQTVFWLECPDEPFSGNWVYRTIDDEIKGTHCLITGDVDGDGKLDLIANSGLTREKTPVPESWTWQKIPADPLTADHWIRNVFADGDAPGGSHYAGIGDVDGDGRPDISGAAKGGENFPGGEWFAWWQQPEDATAPWKKHPGLSSHFRHKMLRIQSRVDIGLPRGSWNRRLHPAARLP